MRSKPILFIIGILSIIFGSIPLLINFNIDIPYINLIPYINIIIPVGTIIIGLLALFSAMSRNVW
ncbi:hypothetical protein CO154_00185 [Candidatus Pacearchaeota archaeon CG_4_9_14_3_um_filter_31_7]|nr:MAG: hypothetical protein AUJ10_00435 [Candidatus Pacearchaeota archaeon CG1_02_31_27]PIN92286.1 MAG: hypothetical protein COU55_00530 [Candidatus Pacearchaeota archaeon CG10_big_fil_rev_8_21_14_0_10_31_59]PIZ81232.1 MAG: hypothetical protein COX99_00175 [Candidatus Pacearchaeota archaeon CG_4_10_14_0_2_um_filter_31_10]PJA70953.1 MAG: hypothetical protein CO154_00185 [Candidatus Pacearchaeota archaeon CG_4_9_14_3_um_filter_31_7]